MLDMSQLMALVSHLFKDRTYGDTLQQYIESRNPKSVGDVERLTQQFSRHFNAKGGALW